MLLTQLASVLGTLRTEQLSDKADWCRTNCWPLDKRRREKVPDRIHIKLVPGKRRTPGHCQQNSGKFQYMSAPHYSTTGDVLVCQKKEILFVIFFG